MGGLKKLSWWKNNREWKRERVLLATTIMCTKQAKVSVVWQKRLSLNCWWAQVSTTDDTNPLSLSRAPQSKSHVSILLIYANDVFFQYGSGPGREWPTRLDRGRDGAQKGGGFKKHLAGKIFLSYEEKQWLKAKGRWIEKEREGWEPSTHIWN